MERLEGTKTYHQLEGSSAIALGGLCRKWLSHKTGETIYSASIITLPPHPKLKGIHEKVFPMMWDVIDQATTDRWLDRHFQAVEDFAHVLIPQLVTPLRAIPIDRPSR